jgi:two-component system chemotaxis response regulator CheB
VDDRQPDRADVTPEDHPVIALVGSVGSLEAAFCILAALPEDLRASLIVLLHQDPDRPSELTRLLARRSALPVADAEHDKPLTPGQVIVVPPGRHLLITPKLRTVLIVSGAPPPNRPSADLLLATLAVSAGSRAIAVVLSGGGHDAATGATAVHVLGGVVVATDEPSSKAFSMPQATIERDHAIDHIVPLDEVAPLLVRLVTAGGT